MNPEPDNVLNFKPPLADMIKVMQEAQEEGCRIFYRTRPRSLSETPTDGGWIETTRPAWNWGWSDYMIVPAKRAVILIRAKQEYNWQQWNPPGGGKYTASSLKRAWNAKCSSEPEFKQWQYTIIEID